MQIKNVLFFVKCVARVHIGFDYDYYLYVYICRVRVMYRRNKHEVHTPADARSLVKTRFN